MKICIIGASTIGSIYGVAMSLSGHSVSFYCRSSSLKKYSAPIICNIIDKRSIIPLGLKYQRDIITSQEEFDDFHLIIVCVRHYQLSEILNVLTGTKKAHVLFFCNNWSELAPFYEALSYERTFFGMPRAGGNITETKELNGGVFKEVIIGNSNASFHSTLLALFDSCSFKVTRIEDMQSWYWTHMATTVAWITGSAKAGGFVSFSRSWRHIKQAVLVGREAINVSLKRGAKTTTCKDADVFRLPCFIAATLLWFAFKSPVIQVISKGHATPDDLKAVCYEVFDTAKKLKIHTPLLLSAIPFVDDIS